MCKFALHLAPAGSTCCLTRSFREVRGSVKACSEAGVAARILRAIDCTPAKILVEVYKYRDHLRAGCDHRQHFGGRTLERAGTRPRIFVVRNSNDESQECGQDWSRWTLPL